MIHGAEDEVVEINKALTWAEPQDLPVVTIAGSSHFFHGKLIVLRDTITRFAPAFIRLKSGYKIKQGRLKAFSDGPVCMKTLLSNIRLKYSEIYQGFST